MIARPYSDNPVIAAAISGDIQALKDAIAKGCTKEDKNEALLAAVEHGHLAMIPLLAQYGVKINYCDSQGARAIAWAVQIGRVDIFNELLKMGAELNVRSHDGSTLLMLALRFGNEALVTILKEKGFKIDDEHIHYVCQHLNDTKADLTWLLRWAVETSCLSLVVALLDNNIDPNQPVEGRLPLCIAAKNGDKEIVKALLGHGAKINLRDEKDLTPLYIAAIYERMDVMRVLLENKDDANKIEVDLPSKEGHTPLMCVAEIGDLTIAGLLIASGANVNAVNEYGVTPLIQAAGYPNPAMIAFLLEHGAEIQRKTRRGKTALMKTVVHDKEENMKVLLAFQGESKVTPEDIKECYQFAKKNNKLVALSVLSDLALKDKKLASAVKNKNFDEASRLINEGANINALDKVGNTPLMVAALDNEIEIARFLISKKADVNVQIKQNGMQWTALSVAARHAGWELCQLLIDAGAVVTDYDRGVNVIKVTMIGRALTNKNDDLKKRLKVLLLAGATVNLEKIESSIKKKYYTRKAVDQLFDVVIECLIENIKKLFSFELMTDEVFSHLLTDTNSKTAYLINRKYERSIVRDELVTCLGELKSKLPAIENLAELRAIRRRMFLLSTKLTVIQKTEKDKDEKTAKKKLLDLIVVIKKRVAEVAASQVDLSGVSENPRLTDETKAMLDRIQACFNHKPSSFDIEKMIADHLLRQPAQDQRHEIMQFLTKTLNSNQRNQLKKYLYDAMDGWSKEYKMEEVSLIKEEQDEPASRLIIDVIKASYEAYKHDETKASTDELYRKNRSAHYKMPILFEILRVSESGRVDVDTGTWSDFVKLMKDGNFLKTHPLQSQGVFKDKTKREEKIVKEMKLFTLGT